MLISMMFPLYQNGTHPCRTLLPLNPTPHLECSPSGYGILLKPPHPEHTLLTLIPWCGSSASKCPFQCPLLAKEAHPKYNCNPSSYTQAVSYCKREDVDIATSESSSASSQCLHATPTPPFSSNKENG